MPLYSPAELNDLPEFEDLDEALRNPEKVIRFQGYRIEDAARLARIREFRNLQSLSISLSNVEHLIPRLAELKDLQEISFQACNILEFPEGILSLSHLRSLSLGNNGLRTLPDGLCNLVKLEKLGFSQNELKRVPDKIGQLTGLKVLGLSYNQIEAIPECIGELAQLEYLFLDVNELEELPATVGRLIQLRNLNVRSNNLRTLPDSIGHLQRLEYLSLDNNPFESLPSCLSEMTVKDLTIDAPKRSLFMDWSYPQSAKPPRIELADMRLFVSPTSDLFESLMESISGAGLSKCSSSIAAVAREAIKVESTVPDDYSQPGSSRLGGFPDLSSASDYPKTDDLHWVFLAQINLAEVAPLNSFLPRSGLLSFFIDSTESRKAKVVFHEGDVRALETVRHGGAEEMTSPEDDYTQKPYRAKFSRFFSLPHRVPDGIEGDALKQAYSECDDLCPSVDHHLNGYTFTQHESPQEQAADEFRGKSEEWVPLLQLGWDDNVGFCFWDAGTLTFSIHQEDLRRHDFSKVHVALESS